MILLLYTFVIILYLIAIFGSFKSNTLQKKHAGILFLEGILIFLIVKFGIYGISSIGELQLLFFNADIRTGSFHDLIKYIQDTQVGWAQIVLLAFIPAAIEEGGKGLSLILHNKSTEHIKSSSDMIWAIVYIALGFSLGETINYIYDIYSSSTLSGVSLFIYSGTRSILLGCGHLFFSLIIGICYSQAKFGALRRIDQKKRNKRKILERSLLPLIGIVLATGLHTIFNVSIGHIDSIYGIILVYGGMYVFSIWIQHIPFLMRKYNPLIRKIELLKFIKSKKEEIKSLDK